MTVRAKFVCVERTETPDGYTVRFEPVTGGSPENDRFYKWTPSGAILLTTINKEAGAAFVPFGSYYVDFSPAD